MKTIITKFIANIKVNQQGTGNTNRKPQQIDEREKLLTLKISEEEKEVISEHER
jgi:hypothetical protein